MSGLIFPHCMQFDFYCALLNSKRILVIYVSQDGDEAFGWSQLRETQCLEKVKIAKLHALVP